MWCILSVVFLSTLHSINQWSCLLSSAFAWGQVRSKLGGVDTSILHHYFYILIYCYLLIFIILGYNTYVILPVLHVWWLWENKSPEPGICWKKRHQDTVFTKTLFWWKSSTSSYYSRWQGEPKGGTQVVPVGPAPPGGADAPLGARADGVVALAHRGQPPFTYLFPLKP